ncbi:MAG: tetratricopeptide repeat protein [Paracoccaceae bacterium]
MFGAPSFSEGLAGPYLAGRQASLDGRLDASVQYFSKVVAQDSANIMALEQLILAQGALGRFEQALPAAQAFINQGANGQWANLVVIANTAKSQNYSALSRLLQEERGIGHPLIDDLIEAWSLAGSGDYEAAIAKLKVLSKQDQERGLANYHLALIYKVSGDYQAADDRFDALSKEGAQVTRRAILIRLEALMQDGQFDEAGTIFDRFFTEQSDPELDRLQADIAGKRSPKPLLMKTAEDGLAEVFFAVAQILNQEQKDEYSLFHAQLAQFLSAKYTPAALLSAEILVAMRQYDLAIEAYRTIAPVSALFPLAELGRADALRDSGKTEAAIEVLRGLSRSHEKLVPAHQALGNLLRSQERYDEAVMAYTAALDLLNPTVKSAWRLFYARGMANERMGDWPAAEQDFRQALALQPEHPQVLNYLGYSLVEKRQKLDEALEMIQTAVDKQPESGYIVDSLGWVFYRLGRFEEALPHLERAAELMPIDPIVNDHLGDVFWEVGRKREAVFQWRRALSFDPEETDRKRILRKLEVGLERVLEEEAEALLSTANPDG